MKKKILTLFLIGSFAFAAPINVYAVQSGDMVFAICNSYVAMRAEPNTDSEVVGRLYNYSAATIIDIQDGWYHISSGDLTGWSAADYFIEDGTDVNAIANMVGYQVAVPYVEALNVRSEPSEDSEIIGVGNSENQLPVVSYDGGAWVTVSTADGYTGYVNADYVSLQTYYPTAEVEPEPVYYADTTTDYINNYYDYSEDNYNDCSDNYDYVSEDTSEMQENYEYTSEAETETQYDVGDGYVYDTTTDTVTDTNTGEVYTGDTDIVNYARQFVGKTPYSWGGNSYETGMDCSHFVWNVLKDTGAYDGDYVTSDGFLGLGETVDGLENAQAGDVIVYNGHVAIYDGEGGIIEAKGAAYGTTNDRAADSSEIIGIRRFN